MSKYLSPEWLDRFQELGQGLPERPGVTARVEQVVPRAPDGEVRYLVSFVDGRVVDAGPEVGPDPDVSLTTIYPDAVKILNGELDANAAFMSGRTKVAGSTGTLLRVLALMGTPEYDQVRAELASVTEF